MAPNPRRIDERLQALYDQVPQIPDCDGRCWDSCGPISMSVRERERIRERTGVTVESKQKRISEREGMIRLLTGCLYCPLLKDERCSAYDIRPMICRLWGASEVMTCGYGCTPQPRALTGGETFDLLVESFIIGGEDEPMYSAMTPERRELARRMAAESGIWELMERADRTQQHG